MATIPKDEKEHRIISVNVGDISGYEFEGKVSNIILHMGELIKKHGPGVRLDWDPTYHYDYDPNPSPRYWIRVDRLETDQELKERLEKRLEQLNAHEAHQRKQYEELKSKFGE